MKTKLSILQTAARRCARAAARDTSAFGALRITEGSDYVILSTTGYSASVWQVVPAQDTSQEDYLVVADQFVRALGVLSGTDVKLWVGKGNRLVLHDGSRRAAVPLLECEPHEFPMSDDEPDVPVHAATLSKMLTAAATACSNDETRPSLTGVSLILEETGIRVQATDGHRVVSALAGTVSPDAEKALLAKQDALILANVMQYQTRAAHAYADAYAAFFHTEGNNRYYFDCLEGPFPDLSRATSPKGDRGCVLDVPLWKEALRSASSISDNSSTTVELMPHEDGGVFMQLVNEPANSFEVTLDGYGAGAWSVRLQTRYLIDMLGAIEAVGGTSVRMWVVSETEPVYFTIEGPSPIQVVQTIAPCLPETTKAAL